MKRLLFLLLFLVSVLQGFSQTVGISYQGVILNPDPQELPGLDAQGNILVNSIVSIQFTIVNESGIQEYQEQHNTSTDRYGMINLLIGSGSATGGTDFTDILWNGTTKKLKVGIDFSAGSNFMALSEQDLTYMPQPPAAKVTFELAEIKKAITDEVTRAELAELANATGISTIETDQTTQNTAIGLNTVKEGISSAQASSITGNTAKISFDSISSTRLSSTEGTNTGDQDISGIAINATGISTIETDQTTQNTAITANTAKVGYTEALVSANTDVAANTSKVGITAQQSDAIEANTVKDGVTAQQSDAITANTAKVGYTEALVSANTDVAANTSKVGITAQQSDAIEGNTAKDGVTAQQSDAITANTAKVGYTEALVSANTDVAANTSKVGITAQQSDAIEANTAKDGVTAQQSDAITANTAKVGYTEALVSANTDVAANTSKVGITAQQSDAIEANTAKDGVTAQQSDAITANTAKVGMPEGTATGEMNYWDGNDWVVVVATNVNEGATLQMISGVPTWMGGTPPATAPDAPIIGIATAGDAQATVTFTAPTSDGGSAITAYTASISSTNMLTPVDITSTLKQAGNGTITVTGLTNGAAYTFTVTATNAIGTSAASAASNLVTPIQPQPATVGDLRAGGVVFWVDPTDNTHGLVCALEDYQSTVEWGCYETDLPSVPNVFRNDEGDLVGPGAEIGYGEPNTTGILADCSSAPAALAARSYGPEWFLPSINELNEIYVNKETLESVSGVVAFSNSYWSSTEGDFIYAWFQYFDIGNQYYNNKYYTNNVRAVRAF
jgi:hypothetical protein